MNKKLLSLAAIAALSLLLSGCFGLTASSDPSHFYRLDTPTTQDITTPEAPSSTLRLLVKVELAELLQGPRMIIADSSQEIKYLETQRWVEPLEEAIARVVVDKLSAYFAAVEAVPALPGYQHDVRVHILVNRAWATERGEVVLQARWVATNEKGERVAADELTVQQKGWERGDWADYSSRMAQLSVQLANSVKASLSSLDEKIKK